MSQLTEVRCCCSPENLIGFLPQDTGEEFGLSLRELNDGTMAFDSNHNDELVKAIPGFEEANTQDRKTWKKTWRK